MLISTTLVDTFNLLFSYLKCFDKDVKNVIFVRHWLAYDITKDEKSSGWYSAMYILY